MCRGAEGASILLPGAAALAYDRHRPRLGVVRLRGMGWVLLLAPLAVFIATWWLTGRVRLWLARRAILDRPVARSAHAVPVPRGGGLALMPAVLGAWLVLALLGR